MEKFSRFAGLVSLALVLALGSFAFFGKPANEVTGLGISQKASKFTDVQVTRELQTTDLTVTDDASVAGDLTLTGDLISTNPITVVSATVATTTLTVAQSGEIFSFTTTTQFKLPTVASSAGVVYTFVVGGAITSNVTVVTNALGDEIEGTLLVAGAVVDCAAEDTVTFVADGENEGDFFSIFSDGTNWYLGASGALTASKLTCSAT